MTTTPMTVSELICDLLANHPQCAVDDQSVHLITRFICHCLLRLSDATHNNQAELRDKNKC